MGLSQRLHRFAIIVCSPRLQSLAVVGVMTAGLIVRSIR